MREMQTKGADDVSDDIITELSQRASFAVNERAREVRCNVWLERKGQRMTTDELKAIFCQVCTAEPLAEGWQELEKFGLAVAEAEREACAKIADARAMRCEEKTTMAEYADEVTELRSLAWQFSALAAEMRKRSNDQK